MIHRAPLRVYISDNNLNSNVFLPISVSRVDGPVLELHKVRRSEAGSYLCIASNGHPPTVSRRVQLDIKCRLVRM